MLHLDMRKLTAAITVGLVGLVALVAAVRAG